MSMSSLNIQQLAEAIAMMGMASPPRMRELLGQLSTIEGQDDWVSSDHLDACYQDIIALSGRSDLGLQLACSPAVMRYGVIPVLLLNSPDLAAALANIQTFAALLQDETELALSSHGEEACITIAPMGCSPLGQRCRTEFVTLGLTHVLRIYGRGNAHILRLDFTHPAPEHLDSYVQQFNAPLRFGCPANQIVFARSALQHQIPGADPMLYSSALARANIALSERRARRGLVQRLTQELSKRLDQRPHMADVARDLGCSDRTLRRHLREVGVDYQALLVRLQTESACAQLAEHKRNIQQIAASLGFSQASAFHRAFLRWTGMTPKAWQEAQAPSVASEAQPT
jgi:AraC-like DNA-binding protein